MYAYLRILTQVASLVVIDSSRVTGNSGPLFFKGLLAQHAFHGLLAQHGDSRRGAKAGPRKPGTRSPPKTERKSAAEESAREGRQKILGRANPPESLAGGPVPGDWRRNGFSPPDGVRAAPREGRVSGKGLFRGRLHPLSRPDFPARQAIERQLFTAVFDDFYE